MVDIILIIFKFLFFVVVCFSFGWLIIMRFLRERSLIFKIGGAFLFGFSFYTFLLNLLSYFIAIKVSFYLVLFVFSLFILLNSKSLIKQIKEIKTLDLKKVFNPVSITAFIILLSIFWIGLGCFREDLFWIHIPTAATIAEGNFPILNVAYPIVKLIYHYAPELLAAAIYRITGLPIWLVYNFLFAFFTCLIFVFGFVLSQQLTKKFKVAYWASLTMLFAGGFYFIYIFTGFKPLYAKFILKQNIEAPFAFFSSVLGRDYLTQPLIASAGNHSLALAWGFALALAVIYLFLKFFTGDNKKWFSYAVIISIVFGFLALSSEVLFVVLAFVFSLYLLLTLILKRLITRQRILGLFIILFIGGTIAMLQGGVLGQFSVHDFNRWTLRLSDRVSVGGYAPISLFSLTMLRGFGLSIILLPLALFYWRKNRNILLLVLLPALICFSVPFIVEYVGIGDLQRFFIIALALLGLLAGLYLGDLLGKYPTKKIIIYFLILIVILNGLSYYFFDLFYPTISAYRHNHSMVAIPSSPSRVEQKAYNWIKQNTTIRDVFLVKREVPEFAVYKQKYGGESRYGFIKYNSDFITHTGRLIVEKPWCEEQWCSSLGPLDSVKVSDELARLDRVKQTCQADILQQLRVKFIYLEANHFADFEERCLQSNNLKLELEAKERGEVVRIYKLLH